jgi:hypothetical protein
MSNSIADLESERQRIFSSTMLLFMRISRAKQMARNSADKRENPNGRGEKRLSYSDGTHTPPPALSSWTDPSE